MIAAPREMSAGEFKRWLTAMKLSGRAAAKVLGVSVGQIVKFKREGAPGTIRMTCRVIYPHQSEAIYPWEDR